ERLIDLATRVRFPMPQFSDNGFCSFTKDIVLMLLLNRRRDERIMIGDDITVMVIEIRGDRVRLGVDATKEVTVHREEVYEAIQREQIRGADAACDVKGLAGANAEMELYR